ncbi:hypothetical protein AYL99_08696 [Fonsecaea erecta]|uniref:Major facilitator superfamily (MFS) profile domain-containing protein n=1 Tax=Fonsecaea erecta TaxID=1367422 RepID=A0A178Z9W5_9EURO|nr:hypothetical protein AYL99_08696 [Fonsecaea erecta]OAP56584.1 hypothetical protein AYL99_08696 [Fonsecaea erecta]
MAGSTHVAEFIAFRFVAGASSWSSLAAVPILISEIVPANIRGAMVDFHATMCVVGYMASGWVGFGFYFWTTTGGSNTWRPVIAIQCFWPLCLLVGLLFVPESPRWLMMKGRDVEAETILFKLHANPKDPRSGDAAKAEFYQIQKQVALDRTLGNSWLHILTKPSYRKRLLLAVTMTGISQCSGVLVINNYGPLLYRSLGFSPAKQLIYPAGWNTLSVGLNIIGMILVDRFPRPKYLAFGLLGCTACLIVEAALVANFVPSDKKVALQAAVAMFFVFLVFYDVCINGTFLSYMGEIFPTHLRAKGMCAGVAMVALMNIVWLQSAPTAFATIGWKFYLCFIISSTIGAVVIWILFPDTNGLPLEEVAAIFGDADEVAVYQRDIQDNFTLSTDVNRQNTLKGPHTTGNQGEVIHLETCEDVTASAVN